jgi:mannose-6-phosphate isomerase-like protein (cupin superfamily)
MKSGFVLLKPSSSMHCHTTGDNEEMLIILSGVGQVVLDGKPIPVRGGEAFYIPPRTWHEVNNTSGEGSMQYVYVVAPVQGE